MTKAKWSRRNIIRVLILLLVVVTAVSLVVERLDTFGNILLVMLGFGTVILVHEFGHFIVAKLSDIEVETFSMFMPPTLLGIKRTARGLRVRVLPGFLEVEHKDAGEAHDEGKTRDEQDDGSLATFTVGGAMKPGETEYQLGLIPFGGYVKMLGQEDVGAAKSTNDPRSFANKGIGTRLAVIAAGVTFNAVTAVVIFITAFSIGIKLPPPVVGGVIPGSPAEKAGLRPGDEVLEIDGKTKDLDFSSIQIAAALSGRDEMVRMRVRHEDGTEGRYSLIAREDETEPGFRVFGVEPAVSLEIQGVSDVNELMQSTGLRPGDRITAVAGTSVETYWALEQALDRTHGATVSLTAQRKGKDGPTQTVQTEIPLRWPFARTYSVHMEDRLFHIGSMVPRLKIAKFEPPALPKSLLRRIGSWFLPDNEEAEQAQAARAKALLADDIILAVADVEYPTYVELRKAIEEHENRPMTLRVLRAGEQVQTTVEPRKDNKGKVVVGAALLLDSEHPVVAKSIAAVDGPEPVDIPRGARIIAVNGHAVTSFHDIAIALQEASEGPVTLAYEAPDGQNGQAVLAIDGAQRPIALEPAFGKGVPLAPLRREYRADNPVQAVAMGWRRTVMFIAQAYSTFRTLFTGLVSSKQLMGPVGILHASYKIVEQQPLIYYVYFLGLINAVIAVFNFLPVLPLDGGLAALLLVEKLRGKPLSERLMAVMANAAWILIGALAIYVTFNDIVRIVSS